MDKIVSFSQILPNPAVVGALSVKSNDQNKIGFDPWFSARFCNARNLSYNRLRCESSESNLLHQCCTNPHIFRGESPSVSLVGVTHSNDTAGKEIVSLQDGMVHPHLKVLPLSTDMLKDAIKKCNHLRNENTAKESINLDEYDDKTLAKNLFDTLNEVYPNFNDTTQLENFAKRLDTLINDADDDWRTKSACLPYPKLGKNSSVDHRRCRLRSFIQFNLSVALRICFITLDGIHRGMSFEVCVLGSRYFANLIPSGKFANELKKKVDDFSKKFQSDKCAVTIYIPKSLDDEETRLMRKISRDKQAVNDLAHGITVMDEVSNFLNDLTKFIPPPEITEETLKTWSYEIYKQVKDFIDHHGKTFGVQSIPECDEAAFKDGNLNFPTKLKAGQSLLGQMLFKESASAFSWGTQCRVELPTSKSKIGITKSQAAIWLIFQLHSIESLSSEIMHFLRQSWPSPSRNVVTPNSPSSAKNALVCFYQLYIEVYFRTYTYWDQTEPNIKPADRLEMMTNVTKEVLGFFKHFQNMHPVLKETEIEFDTKTKTNTDCPEDDESARILKRHLQNIRSNDAFVLKVILNYAFRQHLNFPIQVTGGRVKPKYSVELNDEDVSRHSVPKFINPNDILSNGNFEDSNSCSIAGCKSTDKEVFKKFKNTAIELSTLRTPKSRTKKKENAVTHSTQAVDSSHLDATIAAPAASIIVDSNSTNSNPSGTGPSKRKRSSTPTPKESLSSRPSKKSANGSSKQSKSGDSVNVEDNDNDANSDSDDEIEAKTTDNVANSDRDEYSQAKTAAVYPSEKKENEDDGVNVESDESEYRPRASCTALSNCLQGRHKWQSGLIQFCFFIEEKIREKKKEKTQKKKECADLNEQATKAPEDMEIGHRHQIAAGELQNIKEAINRLRSITTTIEKIKKYLGSLSELKLGYQCLYENCSIPCSNFSLYCPEHITTSSHYHQRLYPSIEHASNILGAQSHSANSSCLVKPPCSYAHVSKCEFESSNDNEDNLFQCQKCFILYSHHACFQNYVRTTKSTNGNSSSLQLCYACISSDDDQDDTSKTPLFSRCVNCLKNCSAPESESLESSEKLKSILLDPTELTSHGKSLITFLSQQPEHEIQNYYFCKDCGTNTGAV